MTVVPVYSFNNLQHSEDGDVLSCICRVPADLPAFKGHFPGMPIMPAAAQIEMLDALLQQQTDWHAHISSGRGLKFSGRIQPGDTLAIRLQRTAAGAIDFRVENNHGVVSRGMLQLASDPLG
jgi:3-hydroxymyristoyl/3-hydroxydecanoyl-(acyl carrier protein) dehydratase